MAHADYACCSICSSKMFYEGFSEHHKTQVCSDCAIQATKKGIDCSSNKTLLEWIAQADKEKLPEILKELGYSECYYENEIDSAIAEKLGIGGEDKPKDFMDLMKQVGLTH